MEKFYENDYSNKTFKSVIEGNVKDREKLQFRIHYY